MPFTQHHKSHKVQKVMAIFLMVIGFALLIGAGTGISNIAAGTIMLAAILWYISLDLNDRWHHH